MSDKNKTDLPTGQNTAPATAAVVSEPTATVQAIPATAPNRTLWTRFGVAKASTNAKAPIARCAVQLDGVLTGMIIDVPIFRAKDGNGVSAMAPGGSFPAVKAKNKVVKSGDGTEHETTALDPIGAAVADQLLPLIVDAYGKWQITKNPVQSITFAG